MKNNNAVSVNLCQEINRSKFKENAFYVIFVIWFLIEFVYGINVYKYSWGTNPRYISLMYGMTGVLVLYIAFFQRYSFKNWIYIGIISVLLFYTAMKSHFLDVFYAWLFIIAAKKKDSEKIIKITAILLCICIPLTVCLALTGVLDNRIYARSGGLVRYSLGFQHPNQFGFRLFILITCLLYLSREKKKIWIYCLASVFMVFSWVFLNSRTSVIAMCVIVIFAFLKKYFDKLDTYKKKLILYAFFIISIVSAVAILFMTVFYNNKGVRNIIDRLLSARLSYGHEAYSEWGIKLLGQRVFLNKSERVAAGLDGYVIVDNAYVNTILRLGIVVFFIMTIGYCFSILRHIKASNFEKSAIMIIMSIYCVIELMPVIPMWNIFLIFVSDSFVGTESDDTFISHIKNLCLTKNY